LRLLLSHPEVDYQEYFIYSGLCQVLGPENVVDYPWKEVHHGAIYDGPIPWYGEGKTGRAVPPPFFRDWPAPKRSFEEVVDMIDSFDLIVMGPRYVAVSSMRRLRDELGLALPPVVLVDGEDYPTIDLDMVKEFDIRLVFKRELSQGVKRDWVHPFPFSSYIVGDPRFDYPQEKELDIFFVAGATHPSRANVVLRLDEIMERHGYSGLVALDRPIVSEALTKGADMYIGVGAHRLTHEDYLRHIAKAKIAVSVRGWGRDTVRMWEIPSYRTLLLSDDLYGDWRLVHPHPFTDGKDAAFFRADCSDLEEKVTYYLEHEEERRRVAEAGYQHLGRYHTNRARAEEFLDRVEEIL